MSMRCAPCSDNAIYNSDKRTILRETLAKVRKSAVGAGTLLDVVLRREGWSEGEVAGIMPKDRAR